MNDIIPQPLINNALNTALKPCNGTATPITIDCKTMCSIIAKYYRTPKKVLSMYIPAAVGVRLTTVFKVMIIITEKPGITLNYLTTEYNVKADSCRIIIEHLLRIEFIIPVGKPRYVVPFGRYKIDKGYKITSKGETVLNKLLNY